MKNEISSVSDILFGDDGHAVTSWTECIASSAKISHLTRILIQMLVIIKITVVHCAIQNGEIRKVSRVTQSSLIR